MGEDENGEEGKEEGWREREKGKEQTLVISLKVYEVYGSITQN